MEKQAILVVGAPRSGTSATSHVLSELGVYFGSAADFVDPAKATHNPIFFELKELNDINDVVLAGMGFRWSDFDFFVDVDDAVHVDNAELRARAVGLLRHKLRSARMIGLKDPRFAATLPFWGTLLAEEGYRVRYVMTDRSVDEIEQSNAAVNKLSDAYQRRVAHLSIGLSCARIIGCDFIVVNYDRLVTGAREEVHRLAAWLGATTQDALGAINVIENTLRHQRSGSRVTGDLDVVAAGTRYRKLVEDLNSYGITSRLAELRLECRSNRAELAECERGRDRLQAAVSEAQAIRDRAASALEVAATRREEVLDQLRRTELDWRKTLAELGDLKAERGLLAGQLSEVTAERDALFGTLATARGESGRLAGELSAVTTERDALSGTLATVQGESGRLLADLVNAQANVRTWMRKVASVEDEYAALGAESERKYAALRAESECKQAALLNASDELRAQASTSACQLAEARAETQSLAQQLRSMRSSSMWRFAVRVWAPVRWTPPGVRTLLRRVLKSIWWCLTPQRIPARIRFLKARRKLDTGDVQSPVAGGSRDAAIRHDTRETNDSNALAVDGAKPLEPVRGQPALATSQKTRQACREYDLSNFEVISFDVFDTAILRLLRHPTDLFRYIEDSTNRPGFAEWRRAREQEERGKVGMGNEVSLAQIYRGNAGGMQAELEVELAACVANPEIYELYRKAILHGKKVIFTSDMYLPKASVEQILRQNGYTQYTDVYVSSDDNKPKWDGSRFRALASRLNCKSCLHVGDNAVADVAVPRQHGFATFAYEAPEDFYRNDGLLGSFVERLQDRPSLGVSSLLGAYRYWKLGISRTNKASLWREIGFFFGGPLILGFMKSLYTSLSESHRNEGIYFVARDGNIMKQVFDFMYGDSQHKTFYLAASRRCMTFPLFDVDSPEAASITRMYEICESGTTPSDVMDRLGYHEIGGLRGFLSDRFTRAKGHIGPADVRDGIAAHKADIRRLAAAERAALDDYLTRVGLLEGESILVDVGWSGTIQNCLDVLYPRRQSAGLNRGVYIGVNANVEHADRKSGYLFSALEPELGEMFLPFLEFIEFLTSAPENGFLRFVFGDDGSARAIRVDDVMQESVREDVSTELQRGVMEFCGLAKRRRIVGVNTPTPGDFLSLFRAFRHHANEDVVRSFGHLSHARLVNGRHNVPVLAFNRGSYTVPALEPT